MIEDIGKSFKWQKNEVKWFFWENLLAAYDHCSHCFYALLGLWIHHLQSKYETVYCWNMLEVKKNKNYLGFSFFFHSRFFMSDYRAIFCGTYVQQFIKEVPAIRSWVHTSKVVGNKINMLEKNKFKWFFW